MSGLSADDTKCAETGEWLVELRGFALMAIAISALRDLWQPHRLERPNLTDCPVEKGVEALGR
jgi:hypothetical protein